MKRNFPIHGSDAGHRSPGAMRSLRSPFSDPDSRRGVALVITLACLVLATFVAMAFFSKALSSRQIEDASGRIVETELLARSALEVVVSDLKAEIRAGSTLLTQNGTTVYQPAANAAMLPQRVLDSDISATSADYANLVKQSVSRFFPSSAPTNQNSVTPIIQTTTGITTNTPSTNGRLVTGTRWVTPHLLVGNATFADTQLPQWVLMSRSGVPASQSAWNNAFGNATQSNQSFVTGRFAYNIYDVGGLLDVNVAGYASGVSVSDRGRKGSLGLAALESIPGVTNAADFVDKWRNKASGSSASDYLDYLGLSSASANPFYNFGPKNGFLKPAVRADGSASDHRILGRQDLIKLAQNGNFGITTTALPYLTHFTRELNAPSWGPGEDASIMGGNDGIGSPKPYAYKTNANDQAVPNRFLPNVRVNTTFTRLTGEEAVVGEPLIKYRFPLSWLVLLQDANLSTPAWDLTTDAVTLVNNFDARRQANGGGAIPGNTVNEKASWLVQKAFGLRWNTAQARWDYLGSPTSLSTPTALAASIERLGPDSPPADTVVEENREPNFFELLKAGILNGSLGLRHIVSGRTSPDIHLSADYQVLKIGACAIDQAKTDSYPTRIAMQGSGGSTWVAVGVQRLPYVSRWAGFAMRSPDLPVLPETTQYNINFVIVPVLFNPFQGTDFGTTGDNLLMPLPASRPNIRITIQGSVNMKPSWVGNTFGGPTIVSIPATSLSLSESARDGIGFNREDSYVSVGDCASAPPIVASNGLGTATGRWEQFSSDSTWSAFRGFPVGFRLVNYYPRINGNPSPGDLPTNTSPNNGATPTMTYGASVTDPFQISMEYQAQNGQWYPYSTLSGVEGDPATWIRNTDLKSGNFAGYNASHLLPVEFQANNNNARIANFSETGYKADPLSIRFGLSSNNANLGAPSSSRWTKGYWNVPNANVVIPSGYTLPVDNNVLSQYDAGLGNNEGSSIPTTLGSYSGQPQPANFYPAWFCRNNNANFYSDRNHGAKFTSYVDNDEVPRIADSGQYANPNPDGPPLLGIHFYHPVTQPYPCPLLGIM